RNGNSHDAIKFFASLFITVQCFSKLLPSYFFGLRAYLAVKRLETGNAKRGQRDFQNINGPTNFSTVMNCYKLMLTKIFFICYFIFITTIGYGQHFTTIRSGEGIELLENNKKVLFYQVRPKSVGGKYERAGFIHP